MAVTYCNFGGRLIGEVRNGVASSYLPDTEGNIIGITDSAGNVTDTIDYHAFGEVASRTGTTPTPFLYRGALGYYTDQPSGRIYVRARTYMPNLARWLTVDPMWPEQPAYTYVFNNPITGSDPTGKLPWSPCGFLHWASPGCTPGEVVDCVISCWKFRKLFVACNKFPFTCFYQCICIVDIFEGWGVVVDNGTQVKNHRSQS